MRQAGDTFDDLVSAFARQERETLRGRARLGIAVLGPSIDDPNSSGAAKRLQIREALATDGHSSFFPEDLVVNDPLQGSLLDQERRILSQPTVDLVIILCTSTSPGALMEIANFVSVPAIKMKTAILFPSEFYNPDDGLPGNTVREYLVKATYTDTHFESCQLVSECRMWARAWSTEYGPILAPHDF